MNVEVELRIKLNKCRDVRHVMGEHEYELASWYNSWKNSIGQQATIALSVSESEARALWQELGRKLRNMNKEEKVQ